MANDTNENDAYMSLKNLGRYLKTEVGIVSGKIERMRKAGGSSLKLEPVLDDGYCIQATISNTAPVEPDYPLIVFMGVGLKFQLPKPPMSVQRMKNQGALKIDRTNASQDNPFPLDKAMRADTPDYPPYTSDEQKHGHILFPGQSVMYELNLTAKECPDATQVKLWAEGTISRRHLLHHSKEIPIVSESIVYQL
ncbi:hypothetical protein ACFLWR_04690 [Chloroflexota bacterium]